MHRRGIGSPQTPAERRLVEDFQAGSDRAFATLAIRHQRVVQRVAARVTGDDFLGEDVAQEAFAVAWRRRQELSAPGKFRAWLLGITCNIARATRRYFMRHAPDAFAGKDLGVPADPGLIANSVETQEQVRRLQRALVELPETYRQALVLFYADDMSVDEVGRILKIGADAVKQRLSRGRRLLRDKVAASDNHSASVQRRPVRLVIAGPLAWVARRVMPATPRWWSTALSLSFAAATLVLCALLNEPQRPASTSLATPAPSRSATTPVGSDSTFAPVALVADDAVQVARPALASRRRGHGLRIEHGPASIGIPTADPTVVAEERRKEGPSFTPPPTLAMHGSLLPGPPLALGAIGEP